MSDTGAGQVEVPETAPTAPDGSAPDGSVPVDPTPADGVAGAQGPESELDIDPDAESNIESNIESDIDPDAEQEAVLAPSMGDFSMALVSAITVDLPNQHPTVLLRETESPRRQLSFSIGLPDAVALSHALRRIPTPRPLTNELLSDVLRGFDIDVVAVRLVGRQGSVYFAELDLRGRDTRSVLSSRPSDALCVALLQPVPVPILIDRRLLEQAGDVQPAGKVAPTA
jgi:hypothetical protein